MGFTTTEKALKHIAAGLGDLADAPAPTKEREPVAGWEGNWAKMRAGERWGMPYDTDPWHIIEVKEGYGVLKTTSAQLRTTRGKHGVWSLLGDSLIPKYVCHAPAPAAPEEAREAPTGVVHNHVETGAYRGPCLVDGCGWIPAGETVPLQSLSHEAFRQLAVRPRERPAPLVERQPACSIEAKGYHCPYHRPKVAEPYVPAVTDFDLLPDA